MSEIADAETTDAVGSSDRQAVVDLAWLPLKLLDEGRVAEGLAVFDDDAPWWEIAGRSTMPARQMKLLLNDVLSVVPMKFDLIGTVVEGRRVALMVESHCTLEDGSLYNNAYTFVVDVDLERNLIVAIREYVDTAHVEKVLVPAVSRALLERGGKSAFLKVDRTG